MVMNYNSIEEVIDSLLPQNLIDIVYVDLSKDGDVLLIEESRATGKIEELQGYDGLIESNVQFYIRKKATSGATVGVRQLLEQFYMLVYDKVGQEVGNYYIDNVSSFEISSSMRDKDDNLIQSLDFSIRYKRI
jgi:hypothetical protein